MIPLELAKELHIVPESIVKEYADHFETTAGPKNTFVQLLDQANIFRLAGAKPIFLSNQDGTGFAVSSDKTFMQKLH